MVSFLLFISFIIHAITLLCMYFLFKQLKKKNDNDPNEIIEVFDHYLEEIKFENEQLKNELKTYSNDSVSKRKQPQSNSAQADEMEQSVIPTIATENNDQMTASLESQVLHLHKQGKSVEEIAKQLSCGKTEASLIIQLYGENKVNA